MSVIQRIRDKGAWIIFGIIALALIAFILQDGVRRGGSLFSNTTTIGKINGEKIERTDFEQKLALREKMYASQGAQREQLVGSLWSQEVERVVLSQEYEKLGLQVSGKEMSDILFGENSPLKQEFTDPKTGEFRSNDARQALAQIKKSKNAEQINMINAVYIDPTMEQALKNKYQALLQQAVYAPKWLIEKQMADNNAISSISYVYVPYTTVTDSLIKVSDDDVTAYEKKHRNLFLKEEETRSVSFVSFDASPNKADSNNTLNQVMALKNEFSTTTDMAAFLTKTGSESPYYDSYFSKAKMQQVNKDTLVKIPVGGVYGPYIDGPNYVIAKMIAVKKWPDSVKVRHILIATNDPRSGQIIRQDSTGKKLADSIETAVKGGADFAALAAKYSDDPGSKDKGGVYDYFPQGQMVIPFNDFAFDHPIGAKGVVKTDFGYHYIEVLGQKNSNPVYKIAYLSKPIISSPETISAANTAAAQFAATSKSKKDFDANALKANQPIMSGTDIKQNDLMINGLGQNRGMVRWVYEHGVGDVSDPMEINDRYIVAIVTAVNPEGLMSAAEARPLAEGMIRNQKKAKQIIDTKFKGNSIEAFATSTGTPVLRADSLAFSAPIIPGVGNEPKVIGAAFNKALMGKASEPIAGNAGVFAVKVESNGAKASSMDMASAKQNVIQGSRVAMFRAIDALKKAATIKDNRSRFY